MNRIHCIKSIDNRGVATMVNHMGHFVHFSHATVLISVNRQAQSV